MALRVLDLVVHLALIVWLGGLCYICFILPPAPHQEALPPVFVRMMGLMRFRIFNAVCLGVLAIVFGVLPFLGVHPIPAPWQALRVALLLACVVSSAQLETLLRSSVGRSLNDPIPALCDEDAGRVDKVLRQIDKITRALVFFGLGILVVGAMAG